MITPQSIRLNKTLKKGVSKVAKKKRLAKRKEEGSILQKMEPYMKSPRASLSPTENSKKFYHTMELLGCTPKFLKDWLEHQFDSKMSWKNYGSYWQIDHVKACTLFDLTKKEEQLACFNWTNLSPLERVKNISKGNKYKPFKILLQEIKVHKYSKINIP